MERLNITAKHHRKMLGLAAACLCVGLSAVAALSASAGTSVASTPTDPFAGYLMPSSVRLTPTEIEGVARSEAARAGESHPTLQVSATTLETAMRSIDPSTVIPETGTTGERAMYATPVSLVTLRGVFTLANAHVPLGDPAPKGTVLDLIINEHTGAVMGRILPTLAQQEAALPIANSARLAADGVLVGSIALNGGPPRGDHSVTYSAAGAKVIVMTASHAIAATVSTGPKGRFRVRLRPGRYLVSSPSYGDCQAAEVTVRRGMSVAARLSCSIK